MKGRAIAFFIALALLGGALYWHSFDPRYEGSAGDAAATMLFPRILLGAWMLFSIGSAIEALRVGARTSDLEGTGAGKSEGDSWAFGRLAGFMLVVGAYILAFPFVGFLIASIVCALLSLFIFGMRRPILLSAFGVALPVGVWVLFTFVIQIGLPTSPWFDTF